MTNLFELLFRQPPCCRYCGKQIENEDFRTESQPRRLRLGKLRQLQLDPLGVRKPNPKRGCKHMRDSHA